MSQIKISNETLHSIAIKVSRPKPFDLRVWIGCRLIILGTLIAGFSYEESEANSACSETEGFRCPIQDQLDERFIKARVEAIRARCRGRV
jgi:hypothetical protein